MRVEHPPYWFWPLDRWKLLVAALLALLALLLGLRGCSAPQVAAPTLTAPTAGARLTQGALGEVTGTAAPRSLVRFFDGDTLLGEATADGTGNLRFALPALPPGPHTLTAAVVDRKGVQLAASEPVGFNVLAAERAAPVSPTLVFADGQAALLSGRPFVATGTAAPAALVRLFADGAVLGETTADVDGMWTLGAPALAPGAHRLVVEATGDDGLGVTSEPLVVTVTEPAASIDAPVGGLALAAGPGAALTGTAAPGAAVRIFDGDTLLGETTAGPDGKWQFSLPALAAGPHSLAAAVTNPDGAAVRGEPVAATVGPAEYPEPYRVTLGPNESVSVPVAGFCLNYGLPFPGASLAAADVLPDTVRKALAYAAKKGYIDSDPWQTNLAVWALAQDTRLPGRDYTIADEIIRFAQSDAPAPELDLELQSLYTALTNGVVSATLGDYAGQQAAASAYSGKGTLVLRNLTGQTQTLLIPWGTRFRDLGGSGVQDMAILPLR